MMYEITKNNLISFISKIDSIEDRMKNDIFQDATIKIKDFQLKGNVYIIEGTITVTLSSIYKENTIFKVQALLNKNKLVLKNTQFTKNEINDINTTEFCKATIKGETLETIDTFIVRKNENKYYLIHLVNNEINKIYPVTSSYNIKEGFCEEIEPISSEQFEQVNSNSIKDNTKTFAKKRTKRRLTLIAKRK